MTSTVRADSETFARHVVVAQEGHAADIGRDVLRAGGNAVDAAVATAFALAVTLPEAGNLGGGGFIVAYLADRKEVVTVDFREIAPRASSPRMYLGRREAPAPLSDRCLGGRRAGDRPRPGAGPATLGQTTLGGAGPPGRPARARRLPHLRRPGRLLESPVGPDRARRRRRPRRARTDFGRLGDYPESVAAFGKPDGSPWRAGDRLVQADLADTLDRIADRGPDEFYTGRTAQLIARLHERAWRLHHARRPEVLRGQAPAAGPYHVPRPRRLQHRPLVERGRRALPDAQHPRAVRPQGRRPRLAADPPPGHRGDAPRLLHPGHPRWPTPTSSTSPSPS